jgi:protein subunit release factor B
VTSTIRINAQIAIPRSKLRFSFVRSSGPGGQNVNKVASKAVLRWDVARSDSIPEQVRERFLAKFPRRINERGELVISSQRYRDQARNVDDWSRKCRELPARPDSNRNELSRQKSNRESFPPQNSAAKLSPQIQVSGHKAFANASTSSRLPILPPLYKSAPARHLHIALVPGRAEEFG